MRPDIRVGVADEGVFGKAGVGGDMVGSGVGLGMVASVRVNEGF